MDSTFHTPLPEALPLAHRPETLAISKRHAELFGTHVMMHCIIYPSLGATGGPDVSEPVSRRTPHFGSGACTAIHSVV